MGLTSCDEHGVIIVCCVIIMSCHDVQSQLHGQPLYPYMGVL